MEFDTNDFSNDLINKIKANLLGQKTDSYDILTIANLHAAFESAKYFNKKMSRIKNFNSSLELLTHAMNIRKIDGNILEFGVASGRTINHISTLTKQVVYGFDVFSGLPETWRTGFEKGSFGRTNLPETNKNVELIVGLFADTLDGFLSNHHAPISLIHIDCDLYTATKTIFQKLNPLITSGTVIVFDEYLNYPGWQHHEFKAFQEFVNYQKISYRYDSFVSSHQQVCVVIE